MRITNGEKRIDIPAWMVVIGLLTLDNVVCNICKTVSDRKLVDIANKEGS